MNILYFAFANSETQRLPNLEQEERDIKAALETGVKNGDYRLVQDSFANLDSIANTLQEHLDNLVWFHYSGHAEKDALILNDEEIRSKGIAHLLKQCPKLKGVVLNGCSTKWQAEELRAAGIPVVVGTSAPVEDKKATKFSQIFYKMLNKGKVVEQSFEMAMGAVLGIDDVDYFRGGRPPKEEKINAPLWGLFNEDEDALQLKLPFGGESLDELKDRLTTLTTTDVGKTLDELFAIIDKESSKFNTIVLVMGQYNQARRRELDGIARQGDTDIAYARVRNSVMAVLRDLEEEDLK